MHAETPKQEKWSSISHFRIEKMLGILKKIEDEKIQLPEEKTVKRLTTQSPVDLLNFVEEILNDDNFWTNIPESFKHAKEGPEIFKKERLKFELQNLLDQCR